MEKFVKNFETATEPESDQFRKNVLIKFNLSELSLAAAKLAYPDRANVAKLRKTFFQLS